MIPRPLHAVLLSPAAAARRLLEALPAALDGTGPALLPLDPGLPRARLAELIEAFAPSVIETAEDTKRVSPAGRPAMPGRAAADAGSDVGVGDDVAVVIATSGSTGRPKGAELSGAALLASARASLERIGAGPGDRWLCPLPTFHMAGLGVLVRSLVSGTEPVVAGQVDAGILAASGCSCVSVVPTQLRRLLDSGAPLAQLRTILLGGAAPPAGLLGDAAAAGAPVVTTYGMSETCGGCVYDGVPLRGVSADIWPDGIIRLAGPVLLSRYRLAPQATAEVLADGWFRTSDLGSFDDSGRLVIRGRANDVIITGGEKVVAAEVEAVLETYGGVRDVVVVGVPDREWGERVTALVVPADPAAPPALDDLRAHVRQQLPGYAAPRALKLVADIPLLASGKPDRRELRRMGAGSE
ncbi:MAG: AMP-binding protein [Streptosporangiaceae bacterium]